MVDGSLQVAGKTISDGTRREVVDPWTREAFAEVIVADDALCEEAVTASVRAFEVTRRLPSYARRDLCSRIATLLRERAEELALVVAREAGKPIGLARTEVERAATTFALAAEVATQPLGEVLRLDRSEAHAVYAGRYERVPLGPVLAFSPFNFPLNLVAHKVAPALACGASVLVKPAPKTPLSALALAHIAREAGAPEDALVVLPTDDAAAARLVADDRFAVFTFTGSDRVGYMLKARSGKKRTLLELGGNAAAIVHEDVPDPSRALDALTASAFGYAGQVCIKTQRIYVHHTRHAEVLAGLRTRAAALSCEEPRTARGSLGPVVDDASADRIDTWVDEGVSCGARVVYRGARERNRLGPVVLAVDGDTRGLRVVEEEVFGPVVVVCPYVDLDLAFAEVNRSRYGLQAAIFTDSARAIDRAFDALDVGGLVVNDAPSFRSDAMPYGGRKDSGLGREGVAFAALEYTTPKMLVTRRG